MGAGTAAALQVAEDRHAHIILRELVLHTLSIIHGATLGALRHDDDTTLLRLTDAALHESCQLVDICRVFRDDGSLSTAGDGAVLGQEACVATHHLYKEDALMALSRVADAVNTLDDGVHGGVVADGRVGAVKVVVDCAGQADAADVIHLCKLHRACQRAVTAYNDKSVDALSLDLLISLRLSLVCHKLL